MLLTEPKEVFRWLPVELRGSLFLPYTPSHTHQTHPVPRLTFSPCILSLDLHFDCVSPDGGFGGLCRHRCGCLRVLVLHFLRCGFPGERRGRLIQKEGVLPTAHPSRTPPSINLSKEWTEHKVLPLRQTLMLSQARDTRSLFGCPACLADETV